MSCSEAIDPPALPSRELVRACEALAAAGARPTTLDALRIALRQESVHWSREGELLFPQDRTALLIELDELIDALGADAETTVLATARGGSLPT